MRRLRDPRGEAGRSKDPNTNAFSQKEKPTKIDATRIQRIDFFGPRSVSRDLDPSGLRRAAVDPLRSFATGQPSCYSESCARGTMSETRKIAAILAADVVGFSRMASADEDRTLARLRALRADLIDPAIVGQNGHVFKRTGDGALVEFRSVVEAVRCAITIQNAMIERNVGTPAEQRIVFRIGVHLGDVVEESDGDLMGDGVNIAARLESVAAPGAICLSEDAYRQVSGRLDMEVTDLGPTQLKNIAEPIRVFSLQIGHPAPAKPAEPSATERPSAPR